jgi:FixJ family two-component response regulator
MEPADSLLVAIVDDDELFRRSVERLLRSAGFRVEAFGSAEDFLERDALDGAACAVLDVKLPGMNGLELQQRLIERGHRIPIVFVSAHGDSVLRAHALRAGAIEFLKKPFDDSTLLDALERATRYRVATLDGGCHGRHD